MANCEKEVLRIGKQLDKMVAKGSESDDALSLLRDLKGLPISLEVLQKTRIGMSVNSLRKQSESEEVINLAKSLIKGWKKLLPAQAGASPANTKTLSKEKSSNGDSGSSSQDQVSKDGDGKDGSKSLSRQSSSSSSVASFPTNDVVREKCRVMLCNALKVQIEGLDESCELQDPDELSAIIEDCIYTEFGNTDQKYKNRVRSRVSNLQDVKNPELRRRVLAGEITPEKISKMAADEMASQEMKQLRKEYTKEAIRDHQMAQTEGTKTDLLKCNKCGKKNCTYNQMQTRSADEPMTTFVFCNECGHRWKFC